MNQLSPAAEDSLWSLGGKTVNGRHLRDGIRTLKLDDRDARILPKYRFRQRRRRQLAVDWKTQLSSVQYIDDITMALNGGIVQASVNAAECWKDAGKRTLESVDGGEICPTGPSKLVLTEEDLSAVTRQSQPEVFLSNDEDLRDKDDGRMAVEFSNNENYDADVDEELNASSRLMLSHVTMSEPRATLLCDAVREHSHIDEEEHDDNNDDDEDAAVHHRSNCERVASCCRSFISFLASTVGLTCLLVVYTLLGGLLFVALEAQHERLVKTVVMTTRDDYVRQLWNITQQLNVLHPDNWSAMAELLLGRYTDEVYMATKRDGWDGRQDDDDDGDQQWSFAGSLLYSITVVTTIGTSDGDLSTLELFHFYHAIIPLYDVCSLTAYVSRQH